MSQKEKRISSTKKVSFVASAQHKDTNEDDDDDDSEIDEQSHHDDDDDDDDDDGDDDNDEDDDDLVTITPSFQLPPSMMNGNTSTSNSSNDRYELWTIRIPSTMNIEDLDGTMLQPLVDSSSSKSDKNYFTKSYQPIIQTNDGTETQHRPYQLQLGHSVENESFRLLLPTQQQQINESSSKNGRHHHLQPAPISLSKHYNVVCVPNEQQTDSQKPQLSPNVNVVQIRHAYASVPQKTGLKRRYVPFGCINTKEIPSPLSPPPTTTVPAPTRSAFTMATVPPTRSIENGHIDDIDTQHASTPTDASGIIAATARINGFKSEIERDAIIQNTNGKQSKEDHSTRSESATPTHTTVISSNEMNINRSDIPNKTQQHATIPVKQETLNVQPDHVISLSSSSSEKKKKEKKRKHHHSNKDDIEENDDDDPSLTKAEKKAMKKERKKLKKEKKEKVKQEV